MSIQIASILTGSETPTGDGVTGAMRCVLVLQDKTLRSAVLKRGSIGEVTAEAFSALVLRAWGLPVPDPFLIEEKGKLVFASADVQYPNLKQKVGLLNLPNGAAAEAALKLAVNLVCGFPTTGLAVACDEAIDNRDRNLGNVLWDGNAEVWIDHAYSLGQGENLRDVNKLCEMAAIVDLCEKIQRSAIANALIMDRESPKKVEQNLSSFPVSTHGLVEFVADRLSSIGNRIVARFPHPVDLFTDLGVSK